MSRAYTGGGSRGGWYEQGRTQEGGRRWWNEQGRTQEGEGGGGGGWNEQGRTQEVHEKGEVGGQDSIGGLGRAEGKICGRVSNGNEDQSNIIINICLHIYIYYTYYTTYYIYNSQYTCVVCFRFLSTISI